MATAAQNSLKDERVKINDNDPRSEFLEDKFESSDNSVTITTTDCDCKIDLKAAPGGFSETWIKATVTFADFNQASSVPTTTPTEFSALPAGSVLLYYKLKHSVSFTGGTTSDVDLTIQVNGVALAPLDVFQAPGTKRGTMSALDSTGLSTDILDHDSTDSILVGLTITGDTGDNLATGVAEIWIKIATLK